MWLTFQKYPSRRGLIFKTDVHVLETWLYLTPEEKETISASGLQYSFYKVDEDIHGKFRYLTLADFLENSGPKPLDFGSAFEAHGTAQEIRQSVESVATAIQAYDEGRITQDECFEL